MNRKDFLKSLGFSTGAIIATYCMGGALSSCEKEEGVTPSGTVDFTLDLTATENAALTAVGGWLRTNNVVIAQTEQDVYVAVTQVCSHEGKRQVTYRASENDFQCTAHGALFTTTGAGKNSTGSHGLTVYKTELKGTSLRIFS